MSKGKGYDKNKDKSYGQGQDHGRGGGLDKDKTTGQGHKDSFASQGSHSGKNLPGGPSSSSPYPSSSVQKKGGPPAFKKGKSNTATIVWVVLIIVAIIVVLVWMSTGKKDDLNLDPPEVIEEALPSDDHIGGEVPPAVEEVVPEELPVEPDEPTTLEAVPEKVEEVKKQAATYVNPKKIYIAGIDKFSTEPGFLVGKSLTLTFPKNADHKKFYEPTLMIQVDANGSFISAKAPIPTPKDLEPFTDAALSAVTTAKYRTAEVNGQKVKSEFMAVIRFGEPTKK